MGKVYHDRKCSKCGEIGDIVEVWGKYYCKTCYAKRPKTKEGTGNSGMVVSNIEEKKKQHTLDGWSDGHKLKLIPTKKSNPLFATTFLKHYPQSKGILGRQFNYLIYDEGEFVGIIGATSPPLKYKKFSNYFGAGMEKLFLNNNVFCITKSAPNRGTKVLRLFRMMVKNDYKKKYGLDLVGLVTFVEPPRSGTIYQADNWEYLGITQGKKNTRRGTLAKWTNKEWSQGTIKHIFAVRFKSKRVGSKDSVAPVIQMGEGGASPTPTHQEVNI